jgi:hypothetical protein
LFTPAAGHTYKKKPKEKHVNLLLAFATSSIFYTDSVSLQQQPT